ncbi:MAG: hypothetical protein DIZ80_07730 [endosymbiont of Galathealinum brachiosum]|uniref:Carrier domain-containing protein n=1 Tax=endosymbiont of Galathealinum brachiosum TaxID=2200906 RepID=A0A370DIM2_9GAMM|nr:MAG: hypothetical protein DIZ80_07730 [endosymbiont of Galathealinum brachiosum]
MCIKYGDNELDTVKALMTMSLNSIIADIFNLELDEIRPELKFYDDLSMSPVQERDLINTIAEYFDELKVDIRRTDNLNNLFEVVVLSEFRNLN